MKNQAGMHHYLAHLLADLRHATENLPAPYPYAMDHPMPEGMDWIPELALVPFKTIAEWTGIPLVALPPLERLNGEEVETLVGAMKALWEAYHFEFNATDPMPPDLEYDMMLDCWEDYVQYLPLSGCDVELCCGNYEECRMGEDCFCWHNPPDLSFDEPPHNAW